MLPTHAERDLESMHVLAKVSDRCPLACRYCYEGKKSGALMDYTTLGNMTRVLCEREGGKATEFVWHGAEPLEAGINFYKQARDFQKPYQEKGHQIKNGMQSSGVLLTPEIADFLVREEIRIGFSLDGPAEVHDAVRVFENGRGTFNEVMRGIQLMRERGQEVGIIAVLTRKSLPYLDAIYDFFREERLGFKINPVMRWGFARDLKQDLALSTKERVDATCHLFDRWFFDTASPAGRYETVERLVASFFTKDTPSCEMMRSCQSGFIGIETDGSVLPCSRFSRQDGFVYGNVNDATNFEEIRKHPTRLRLLQRMECNPDCATCDYSFLCHAGCMHNALVGGDILDKDPACPASRAIFEHIAHRVSKSLENDNLIKLKEGGA